MGARNLPNRPYLGIKKKKNKAKTSPENNIIGTLHWLQIKLLLLLFFGNVVALVFFPDEASLVSF